MSKARTDGIIAIKAPVAVIFRRGPSSVTQQLVWNLQTDEVRAGQWIRAHVYTRRCDLSPDGRHTVGFYSNFSQQRMAKAAREFGLKSNYGAEAWTAISLVPYFTALALWFQEDTYCGGGNWSSNSKLEINHPYTRHLAIPPPKEIAVKRVSYMGPGEWGHVWHERLRARGWKLLEPSNPQFAMAWEKQAPGGRLLYQSTSEECGDETWSLFDRAGNLVRTWKNKGEHPGFFDFDPRGRLVFAEDGCLFVWSEWPTEGPRLIADLNGNVFENFPPPNHAQRR